MIKPKYYKYIEIGFLALGVILFSINQIVFHIDMLMIISILIALIFPFIIEYNKFRLTREIEDRFPDFLRDVSTNIKAGMTLPQAVMATKKTNYGLLDPYLDQMAAQIDWGIPFGKILDNFAKGKSMIIKRTVSAINESMKGGGNVTEVLDAIGTGVSEINRLRKDRMSAMYSQMLTGYMIFFVFLGVLVALQTMLIPNLNISAGGFTGTVMSYGILFRQLILIQGFFSGLVIGKMAEGKLVSGLKHSLILMTIGFAVLSIFV